MFVNLFNILLEIPSRSGAFCTFENRVDLFISSGVELFLLFCSTNFFFDGFDTFVFFVFVWPELQKFWALTYSVWIESSDPLFVWGVQNQCC